MVSKQKTTVYFDGSCPLCQAEIDVYAKRNAGEVEYLDVSAAENLESHGLTREKAMARFHVMTDQGELKTGAYAFVELWRKTPGFRLLALIGSLPGVGFLLDRVYDGFLIIRPAIQKIFVKLRGTKARG